MAFVNQVLNFTNEAYWWMKNVTSISEATFQKKIFQIVDFKTMYIYIKKQSLEEINDDNQFLEFEDFLKAAHLNRQIFGVKHIK